MLASKDEHHHVDGRWTAYFIFCWLGISSLLPWSVFITAHAYFYERLCKTVFGNTFENYFSIVYTVTQPLGLLLSAKYSKMFSMNAQIVWPLVLNCALFSLMTVFVLIVDMEAHALFGVTLLFTFLSGICTSFINGGLFGFAGKLPHQMTAGIMAGQGLASWVVAMLDVITTLATPHRDLCGDDQDDDSGEFCGYDKIDMGAFAYFLMASLILATAALLFMRIYGLAYIQNHAEVWERANLEKKRSGSVSNPMPGDLGSESSFNMETGNPSLIKQVVENIPLENDEKAGAAIEKSDEITVGEALGVLKRIAIPAGSIVLIFGTSLALYPSLMVLMQTDDTCSGRGGRAFNDMWLPLLFLMFASGDFVGRLSAQFTSHQTLLTAGNIWIPSVLRLCLIPLFMFCKLRNGRLPAAFTGSGMPIFLVLLLGLSNGYLGSMCMMLGPAAAVSTHASARNGSNPGGCVAATTKQINGEVEVTVDQLQTNSSHHDDAALAGILMVLSLSTGLFVGSMFSFLIVYVVTGSA